VGEASLRHAVAGGAVEEDEREQPSASGNRAGVGPFPSGALLSFPRVSYFPAPNAISVRASAATEIFAHLAGSFAYAPP
jgi:hypothetical protein